VHEIGLPNRGASVIQARLTFVLLTLLGFAVYELVWRARRQRWTLFAVLLTFGVVTGLGGLVSGPRGMYHAWVRKYG
jgi:hypothetical protein